MVGADNARFAGARARVDDGSEGNEAEDDSAVGMTAAKVHEVHSGIFAQLCMVGLI